MVPGTKLWKLIHEQNKAHLFNNLFTVYVFVWPYPLMCRCQFIHTEEACMCAFVAANWSRAFKSLERTEFFGQPIKCAVNTSVCLSLLGSDISMSRLYFYESRDPWCNSDTRKHTGKSRAVFVGHCATSPTREIIKKNNNKKNQTKKPHVNYIQFLMTCESLNSFLFGSVLLNN